MFYVDNYYNCIISRSKDSQEELDGESDTSPSMCVPEFVAVELSNIAKKFDDTCNISLNGVLFLCNF